MDGRQGYGYQFWRIRHNGFAMLGMGDSMRSVFLIRISCLSLQAISRAFPLGGLPFLMPSLTKFWPTWKNGPGA